MAVFSVVWSAWPSRLLSGDTRNTTAAAALATEAARGTDAPEPCSRELPVLEEHSGAEKHRREERREDEGSEEGACAAESDAREARAARDAEREERDARDADTEQRRAKEACEARSEARGSARS